MSSTPPRCLTILGSTGSVGGQALDLVRAFPSEFRVVALTCHRSVELLVRQAKEFNPEVVVVGDASRVQEVRLALDATQTRVFGGDEAMGEATAPDNVEVVLVAIQGFAGLGPTLDALRPGRTLAIANKEILVVAGDRIVRKAREMNARVVPVDSEHSAIHQCLCGEDFESVHKLVLTASGGPFLGRSKEYLQKVTPDQALRHPTWSMGKKISVDSATMMNKGLEVIEACHLFGVDIGRIEVVIHPESVLHGMVYFRDGSVKAQLSNPDMRISILYAMNQGRRSETQVAELDWAKYPSLSFRPVEGDEFDCLSLAYRAGEKGGNSPCILNAANEVAVQGFLGGKIGFTAIPKVITRCLEGASHDVDSNIETLIETNLEVTKLANEMVGTWKD